MLNCSRCHLYRSWLNHLGECSIWLYCVCVCDLHPDFVWFTVSCPLRYDKYGFLRFKFYDKFYFIESLKQKMFNFQWVFFVSFLPFFSEFLYIFCCFSRLLLLLFACIIIVLEICYVHFDFCTPILYILFDSVHWMISIVLHAILPQYKLMACALARVYSLQLVTKSALDTFTLSVHHYNSVCGQNLCVLFLYLCSRGRFVRYEQWYSNNSTKIY